MRPPSPQPCISLLQVVLKKCNVWLSYPWTAWALELVVLAGTLLAWSRDAVHSFKNSLWALAAVVVYICEWGRRRGWQVAWRDVRLAGAQR